MYKRQDKTLWITVIAFIISIFVVYTVRRLSVDHAWKIAAASGAVVCTGLKTFRQFPDSGLPAVSVPSLSGKRPPDRGVLETGTGRLGLYADRKAAHG